MRRQTLAAADMVRTVALEPTLRKVAILSSLVTGHIPLFSVSALIKPWTKIVN